MKPLFSKLFGGSPFGALKEHMDKVRSCVEKMDSLLREIRDGQKSEVEARAEEISGLEHAADLAKNEIRNNLPRAMFLSMPRSGLLEILALQDSLADIAEDVAVVLTLRPLQVPDNLKGPFGAFAEQNMACFRASAEIMRHLEDLQESAFGGQEAEQVTRMVDDVAYKEHETDVLQRELLRKLYKLEGSMDHGAFYHWMKLVETLGGLSNLSEKLAHRIRMTLETR